MSAQWLKRIRDAVEEIGYSFEFEETLRVHVGEVILEVGVGEGGKTYTVTVSVQLPPRDASEDELDYYLRMYEHALRVIMGLGGDLRYEIDTSLPEYPALHMVRVYDDPEKLADELIEKLRRLAEVIPPSGGPVEG